MGFFGTLAKTKPQNFIRNILEVTKPQPVYQSDTSNKKPTASFARVCKEEYCNYWENIRENRMTYF